MHRGGLLVSWNFFPLQLWMVGWPDLVLLCLPTLMPLASFSLNIQNVSILLNYNTSRYASSYFCVAWLLTSYLGSSWLLEEALFTLGLCWEMILIQFIAFKYYNSLNIIDWVQLLILAYLIGWATFHSFFMIFRQWSHCFVFGGYYLSI